MAGTVTVGLDDKASAGLDKLKAKLESLGSGSVKQSLGAAADLIGEIPTKAALAVGAVVGMAKAVSEAIHLNRQWHDSIAGAQIATGASAEELTKQAAAIKAASAGVLSLTDSLRALSRGGEGGLKLNDQIEAIKFASGRARQLGEDVEGVSRQVTEALIEGSGEALKRMGLLAGGIDGVRAKYDKLKGVGSFDLLSEEAKKVQVRLEALSVLKENTKDFERMGLVGTSALTQIEKAIDLVAHPSEGLSFILKKVAQGLAAAGEEGAKYFSESYRNMRDSEEAAGREVAAKRKLREEEAKRNIELERLRQNMKQVKDIIQQINAAEAMQRIAEGNEMLFTTLAHTTAKIADIKHAIMLVGNTSDPLNQEKLKNLNLELANYKAIEGALKNQERFAKDAADTVKRAAEAAEYKRQAETAVVPTLADIEARQKRLTREIERQADIGTTTNEKRKEWADQQAAIDRDRAARDSMDDRFKAFQREQADIDRRKELDGLMEQIHSTKQLKDMRKELVDQAEALAKAGKFNAQEEEATKMRLLAIDQRRLAIEREQEEIRVRKVQQEMAKEEAAVKRIMDALRPKGGDGAAAGPAGAPGVFGGGDAGPQRPKKGSPFRGLMGGLPLNIGWNAPLGGAGDFGMGLGQAGDFDLGVGAGVGGPGQSLGGRGGGGSRGQRRHDEAINRTVKRMLQERLADIDKQIDDEKETALAGLEGKPRAQREAGLERQRNKLRGQAFKDAKGGRMKEEAGAEEDRKAVDNVADALQGQGLINANANKAIKMLADEVELHKKALAEEKEASQRLLEAMGKAGFGKQGNNR